MTDPILEKAEEQISVIQAEKKLVKMANRIIQKDAEEKVKKLVIQHFDASEIPFNFQTVSAYLEGAKIILAENKNDEMGLSMFVLAVLKIRESLRSGNTSNGVATE